VKTRMIPYFLRELRRIRARERWSRERVEAFREEQLARVRAHALAHSPYYRELHRGLETAPLTALPTLSKTTMMAHFDDIVTDPDVRIADVRRHMRESLVPAPFHGTYAIVTSSGSTGEVTIVLADPYELTYSLASASRARAFAGFPWSPLRTRRAAEVVATLPWAASGQLARLERSRFAPLLHLNAGDPVDVLIPPLNEWQPELLEGYTTTLGVLAKAQIDGRLRITPLFVGPGGETMTPEVRSLIRQAWGQDPFDYYGTVEGGTHAVECREGRSLHLLDDLLVMEVVDDDNQPVSPGEWGARVLVTPLWRRTQPLIRFEINDSVRMSDQPCVCGRPFPVIEGLRGRTARLIRLPRADGKGDVEVSSMALTSMTELAVVWRRFSQEGDRLVLRVAGVLPGVDVPAAARAMERTLVDLGARPTAVEVEVLDEVPRTAAGKAPIGAVATPGTLEGRTPGATPSGVPPPDVPSSGAPPAA